MKLHAILNTSCRQQQPWPLQDASTRLLRSSAKSVACRCVRSRQIGRFCFPLQTHRLKGSIQQRTLAATTAVEAAPAVISTTRFDGGIHVTVSKHSNAYKVDVEAEPPRQMLMHWAVNAWTLPDSSVWPPGTNAADDKAVQTPFTNGSHVSITFPEDACPNRVVFVLKETSPENWVNNGGTDFAVQLKPPDFSDVADKVLAAEGTYTHWSLFNRFCLVIELLDAADSAGPEGMALILAWLRLSTNRQLDWYRNSSYQSKDIAHVQKTLAQRMADKARASSDPENRLFARMALAGLPRGGGDGDAIRMGILHIMRENGIREGHRPGIEDHFIEQWHQKLHTNTTPEDISICEAYISALQSGYMDDFWRFLWDHHGISREQLANMDHPITATPLHLPQLIGSMQHYLWILKTTHSGADMDTALTMARGNMDGDLAWNLQDLLDHRNEWWVPGKLVELRERLQWVWKAEGASRDVLLLDIALDNYFRLCIERTDKTALSGDDLTEMIHLVLRNAVIATDSEDLRQCMSLWERVKGEERWSKDWGLKALAATQRLTLSLAAFADRIYSLVQPHAERFQEVCSIDPKYIMNFGEEVVRGQPIFVLSLMLQTLDPILRKTAELGSWQVVSQAEATGAVKVTSSLADVQGQEFARPTVLIAGQVGGNEDIPENVTAVLTASTTDVLSHVAIRARSQHVLLATCFDEAELDSLRDLDGSNVSVTVDATGSVSCTPLDNKVPSSQNGASANGSAPAKVKVSATIKSKKWALPESEFAEGVVGGKSRNLAALRDQLPADIALPASVALPFGTFERVLAAKANAGVAAEVKELLKALEKTTGGVPTELAKLRHAVASQLQAPRTLQKEVIAVAEASGLVQEGEWSNDKAWGVAWSAICRVWASKWNDRAWLSRRARGVEDADLKMACLLQQVIPADYAFVVHTANPITGARNEIFGEVVAGMGEALVGNSPGRALSFSATAPANGTAADVTLLSLPSKRMGLFSPRGLSNLIARSDSNGEDLEAFAGAGLYDSFPLAPLEERPLDTAADALFWDAAFRTKVLLGIASLGTAVEAAFGGAPQDIEGVWRDGSLTVVQSRPQVL